MGRTNHRRTELHPTTFRLSPGELELLKAKAGYAGIATKAGAIRAAIAAWNPAETERITKSDSEESAMKSDTDVDNVLRGEHG